MRLQEVPAKDVTERATVPHTAHRDTSQDQNRIRPVTHPVDRSVNWSHSVDDQPEEEARYADFRSRPLVFGRMDW